MDKSEKQWDGKSRGGRFGYQFFVSTIHFLGIRFAYCFLAFIVVYFIPFAPKATSAIWKYNRRIRRLGILRSCLELYCHFYVFGQTLIDKIAIKGGLSPKYDFKFENYDRFLEILNSGQGVIMIGAHAGCWEAGSVYFGKYGKKLNIVMFDAEHQQIKKVLEDNSGQETDYKIIAINNDAIEAMLQIKIALNNGEYVCFNGDRYVDINSAVKKNFMGADAYFPAGPFKIASRCRVPVVFYYAVRERGRTYKFIFEEPVVSKADSESLLGQYIRSLERILERYPRQWFNFYDFWKENN